VDRSYNVAHYLQSEDRIHRLGLNKNQAPVIEIVECAESIDQSVRARLNAKVSRMAAVLDDPSLQIEAVPLEDFESVGEEDAATGLDLDDVRSLLKSLKDY
jgi:hypothetical protein